MRVLHCQNCGKAGLAVFQATTPGRPTLMETKRQIFRKPQQLGESKGIKKRNKKIEKCTGKFFKKRKILKNSHGKIS